jgi:hypothetical protein
MKVSGRVAMTFLSSLSVAVVIAFASSKSANAASTIDPVNKYAWGANIGWTNWLPSDADGVAIGQTFCSGYIYAANGGIGISVGDTVTVRDCAFRENNNDNFRGGAHLTFSHCTAVLSTTGHGFNVGSNCVFTDCVSNSNALYGYAATVHCLFKDCVAFASNNRNYLNTVGDANVGPLQSPDNATSPWANF